MSPAPRKTQLLDKLSPNTRWSRNYRFGSPIKRTHFLPQGAQALLYLTTYSSRLERLERIRLFSSFFPHHRKTRYRADYRAFRRLSRGRGRKTPANQSGLGFIRQRTKRKD